jgi:transcriptional regulator with XRE-family HTH domain
MKKLIKVTELKKRRINAGITQSMLGQLIGDKKPLSTATIGGYERGDNPISKKATQAISKALKAPAEKLFKKHPTMKDRYIAK